MRVYVKVFDSRKGENLSGIERTPQSNTTARLIKAETNKPAPVKPDRKTKSAIARVTREIESARAERRKRKPRKEWNALFIEKGNNNG